MKYQFEKCKRKGKIIQIGIDTELVEKELEEARYDLESAEKSMGEENYKMDHRPKLLLHVSCI